MATVDDRTDTSIVMPVDELHGRVVWNEDGDRLGVVRDVQTDDEGHVESFIVRDRWLMGHQSVVPAQGMRIDAGDIIVPGAATETAEAQVPAQQPEAEQQVFVAEDEEGVAGRFGGIDVMGSLFGALAAFGSIVLIAGMLGAAFGVSDIRYDTSFTSFSDVFAQALVIGAVALFVGCVLGGWAAARSSRHDGVANGLLMCAWLLGLGVASGVIGSGVADKYDVFAATNVPSFASDDFNTEGVLGVLGIFLVMLFAGALGGAFGAWWHRREGKLKVEDIEVAPEGENRIAGTIPTGMHASPSGAHARPGAPQPLIEIEDIPSHERRPSRAIDNLHDGPMPR